MEDLTGQQLITSTVVKIEWERVFLKLYIKLDFEGKADKKTVPDFYFVNGTYQAKAKAKLEEVKDQVYKLSLNITNTGDCRCLAQGTYSLMVCQGMNIMAKTMVDRSIVKFMSDYSRNFLYSARNKVYTVSFFVTEGEDDLPFTMYAMASSKTGMTFPGAGNGGPKKKKDLNPIHALKKTYARNNRPLKCKLYRHYHKKYKNNTKTVLFLSEQSETISTNLAAVRDRMIARGMDKEYTILGSFRSSMTNPKMGFKSWLDLLKKMAMANIIVMDDHAPVLDWLVLAPETKVIQLWHAGAGFKSSGYSRWGHIGCPAPMSCHRQYNYGIAGSKSIAKFFSEVWGINDSQVFPTGMPRIDEYLDEDYRKAKTEELYEKYPMCQGKKVILFAPTYRGRNKASAHYPYELIDFDKLYKLCGDEYVVLFKMHPWVAAGVPIDKKYKDKFIDVGKYPNINDLFYITELLITDYSSNIFEYSLMRKPMLFFAFDEIQYSFSRGFHRDYRLSTPGKVCETFEELLDAIAKKDFEYEKVEEYVDKHFDYIDSHASDRVIDWMIEGKIPEDIQADLDHDKEIVDLLPTLDFSSAFVTEEDDSDED